MYKLEVTEEELLFLHDSCVSKMANLAEAHLEEYPRYQLAQVVVNKIYKAVEAENITEEKF